MTLPVTALGRRTVSSQCLQEQMFVVDDDVILDLSSRKHELKEYMYQICGI